MAGFTILVGRGVAVKAIVAGGPVMDEVSLTRVAVVENLGLGHILGDEERGELGAKFVEVANKITACDLVRMFR